MASMTLRMPSLSISLMVKYWIPKLFRKWLQNAHDRNVTRDNDHVKTNTQMNRCSLFSRVDVSQADVDQIPGRQDRFHPGESWNIWYLRIVVKSHGCQSS